MQRVGGYEIEAPGGTVTTLLRHTAEYFGLLKYVDGDKPQPSSASGYGSTPSPAGPGSQEQYVIAAFEALRYAIRVALRLPQDEPTPTTVDVDPWPVEIFWSCGQAETRSWVTWRQTRTTTEQAR